MYSAPTKPNRTVRLIARESSGALTFAITQNGTVDRYSAVVIDSDFGRTYSVQKIGGERPYVVLVADYPGHNSCQCKGFEYRGKCRHIDVLKTLENLEKKS